MQAQHSTEKETTTDRTQNHTRSEESFEFPDWEAERLLPVDQNNAENFAMVSRNLQNWGGTKTIGEHKR